MKPTLAFTQWLWLWALLTTQSPPMRSTQQGPSPSRLLWLHLPVTVHWLLGKILNKSLVFPTQWLWLNQLHRNLTKQVLIHPPSQLLPAPALVTIRTMSVTMRTPLRLWCMTDLHYPIGLCISSQYLVLILPYLHTLVCGWSTSSRFVFQTALHPSTEPQKSLLAVRYSHGSPLQCLQNYKLPIPFSTHLWILNSPLTSPSSHHVATKKSRTSLGLFQRWLQSTERLTRTHFKWPQPMWIR